MSKYLIARSRKYLFIIIALSTFSLITFSKSFANENIFIIDNVKVKGEIDVNFSRDKFINKAFLNSFEILMSKILISKDLNKISNTRLNKIKNLISSFQILEETYRKDEYKATFHNENSKFSETFSFKFSIIKASFILNSKKILSFNLSDSTSNADVLLFNMDARCVFPESGGPNIFAIRFIHLGQLLINSYAS